MRLYAGGSHGLVQEYAYTHANNSWAVGFTFPDTNGYAGISGTWFPYQLTMATLMMMNTNDELELWWKDTNSSATGNATHPVGEWVRGTLVSKHWTYESLNQVSVLIGNYTTGGFTSNTSVCNSGFLYYQDETGDILGITLSGTAEAQRWGTTFIVDGAKALPRTSITCQLGCIPGDHVYFQTNGSNIVAGDRADSDSSWNITVVPLG